MLYFTKLDNVPGAGAFTYPCRLTSQFATLLPRLTRISILDAQDNGVNGRQRQAFALSPLLLLLLMLLNAFYLCCACLGSFHLSRSARKTHTHRQGINLNKLRAKLCRLHFCTDKPMPLSADKAATTSDK